MMTIDEILQGAVPDGLTVSGGEPTLQAKAVCYLISAFRYRYAGLDVLLYSGQPWSRLQSDFSELVKGCDVVVSEPYVAKVPPRSSLHGSGNQTIHLLTPLAKSRYLCCLSRTESKPLAVTSVTGRQISAVGIPSHIDQLSIALAKRGIKLEQPSWRI
jgi:anaerobic ribonucleoside-triphosphate reductase activating protein